MKITHQTPNGMKLIVENPDEEIKGMMIRKIKESFTVELDHLINKVCVELKEIKPGEHKIINSVPITIAIERPKND